MAYITRELERKFLRLNDFFKVILVTGARQVGKTTMLRHLAGSDRTYVTLDNSMARELAKSDPVLFFQTYKPPVLIDEVQKAPELFEQIKVICDESDEKGLIWLTGSEQFEMMKNVRETLAGRIGILELYSLSEREKSGVIFDDELDFSLDALRKRQSQLPKNDVIKVFNSIWEGGMPQVQGVDSELRQEYFNSYIDTYLMRDVTEAGGITDSVKFRRFLSGCASLVSELVNYRTLAESADIAPTTAKQWLQVLEGLHIVYLLEPYSNNALKRLSKTQKLYFCDTGLCAYLSMWLTPDTLRNGAASGHFYENYVVMELVKNYAYAKSKANITYYRDSNAKEIDIFVEENNVIHPLEIKKSASPDRREVKKYSVLDRASLNRGDGGIICMCEEPIPIDSDNCFIPSNLI
ncbi:MAG: ATP-binding protein [Oscillospiraceae bacterium]|nr:ATP-binding protein [Oscillospiraceae bacterium]